MQTATENPITGRPMPAKSFDLVTSGGDPDWRADRRSNRTRRLRNAKRARSRDVQAQKLAARVTTDTAR